MCGLSGYYRSSKLDESHIVEMTKVLAHRGPDNTGYFEDDRILLGHNRLSIIDLSDKANQPFYSENERYVMVYNGEVYNFKEISTELQLNPKTNSDTEVVIEAYVKWGDSFIEKLNGMFAIAIYDRKLKTLKIWRDRFGIKPVYYYWDGKDFAFASELKALLKLPLPKEINSESIKDYLFLEYIPQPNTSFVNFHKLGHGSFLKYEEGEVFIEKYYDILEKIEVEQEIKSDQAYLDEFTALFESSLRYRTISDVPFGAFLSGGLDSSSVCAGLKDIDVDLSTFNIGFNEGKYDESSYAEQVSKELKTHHFSQKLGVTDLLESKDFLLKHYDEPFAVSSIFPTYRVSQLAKEKVSMALSGDGGDELFMGYGHYVWYQRLAAIDHPVGHSFRHVSSKILEKIPSKYQRIPALLDFQNLSADWPHIWSQEQYMFSEKEITALTGKPYRNQYLRDSWKKISDVSKDPFQRISLFDLQHYLPDDLLYKVDMASMANSLEVRLPFLDHRLVEFAINLPTHLKFKKGRQKQILRNYLKTKLPTNLIDREKWGFGAPVDVWLQNELKPLLHSYLNKEAILNSGVFDPAFVNEKLKAFENGQIHEFKKIWSILVYQIWHENYCKP